LEPVSLVIKNDGLSWFGPVERLVQQRQFTENNRIRSGGMVWKRIRKIPVSDLRMHRFRINREQSNQVHWKLVIKSACLLRQWVLWVIACTAMKYPESLNRAGNEIDSPTHHLMTLQRIGWLITHDDEAMFRPTYFRIKFRKSKSIKLIQSSVYWCNV